jgi:hypothetical protein
MLNEIPVLDKGYVALFSKSMSREQLLSIQTQYFRSKANSGMLDLPKIHMEIKCPLFVQISLTESLSSVSRATGKPEAFVPSVNDISAQDLETSELISKDINQTTQALLMNPKSYQMDGCDIFISQVISPISVYNTLLVSGTLSQWISYVNKTGLPAPIEQYRKVIKEILLSEYDFLWEHIDESKNSEKRKRDRKRIHNKN